MTWKILRFAPNPNPGSLPPVSKSTTNFLQALAAVLAGNVVYFLLLPFLPPVARHVPFQIDFGLAVDGCLCLAFYGILKVVTGRKGESK
jgi:hypothetical protein